MPTVPFIRYWWHRFNREVFGGALLSCELRVQSCSYMQASGLMWPLPQSRARIDIHDEPATKAHILAVLLHEMVHQFQHQEKQPLNHGPTFQAWRAPIEIDTGLSI